MKPDERSGGIWAWAFGLIPVVWLALLVAPAVSGGIPAIIEYFPAAMSAPFHIEWCEDSVKTALLLLPPMESGSGFISLPAATTAGAKNMARQNGAIPGL